jgi:hypothetical protein
MVIGLINQLLAMFGEDYQGQSTHLKEMVSALCASRYDQALLKSYLPFHFHL